MDSRLFLNLAPERRMVMTFALRQALEILQMPQLDLGQWLMQEIEKNPLLELGSAQLKKRFEGDFPYHPTLCEHLLNQIRDHFSHPNDRKKAVELLHLLDDRGFLPKEVENGRILTRLQTFDPPGIFARTLKESFLLQLANKGLGQSLSYALVDQCYEDLLHRRFALIKKKLKTQDLKGAISELSRLSMRPADVFKEEPSTLISPDLLIQRIEGG